MSKNIVICCDGTGNEFGVNNTNVVKIYQLATKSKEQLTCYDPGVATGGWIYKVFLIGWLRSKFSVATGGGLQRNVEDAYKYLMRCYEEGDRIFLFGFSRGAFTVRSLAGMLHKCGLLYPDMFNMVKYASKMYNTRDDEKIAEKFKLTFSRKCPVHFIGVWDTVESLALHAGKKFHDASLNSEVSYGCHAVALDEIRGSFPPSLWKEQGHNNIEQVWFAGVHSDVGGWYGETGLSDIALKWMAEKAVERGMLADETAIANIKGDPLGMQHDSHSGILWALDGRHIRQLPHGAKVHTSVMNRLGQTIKIGNGEDIVQREIAYAPEAEVGGKKLSLDSDVDWVSK